MVDSNIRAALERHWAASDANDFDAEHQIYRQDAVLEYPQSGERIRSQHCCRCAANIEPVRFAATTTERAPKRRFVYAQSANAKRLHQIDQAAKPLYLPRPGAVSAVPHASS
jgi:hypothetical protein